MIGIKEITDAAYASAPSALAHAAGSFDRKKARQFFPRTQAEALAWSGVTWDYGYGDFTPSGASNLWGGLSDFVTTGAMAAIGTPFPNVTSAVAHDGTSERWQAPNATDLEPGASEFAVLAVQDWQTNNSWSNRGFGKYSGYGWSTVPRKSDGSISTYFSDGTHTAQAYIYENHVGIGPFPIFLHFKPDDAVTIVTPLGSASAATTAFTTLDSGAAFRMNGWNSFTPRCVPYLYLMSIGANAAGIDGPTLINRAWRGA